MLYPLKLELKAYFVQHIYQKFIIVFSILKKKKKKIEIQKSYLTGNQGGFVLFFHSDNTLVKILQSLPEIYKFLVVVTRNLLIHFLQQRLQTTALNVL